jgi:hypothetical protein
MEYFTEADDGPEMLHHVERLAAMGFFTLATHNRDRKTLGTNSGLQGDGKLWLGLFKSWNFFTPT